MNITKIEISIGRTINLGNYESARIDICMGAVMENGDDIDETYHELRYEIERKLAAEVDAITQNGINIPPRSYEDN